VSYFEKGVYLDQEVGAVLVSGDDHFSYPKILKAFNYLNDPNCLFLATDKNATVPHTNNVKYPGKVPSFQIFITNYFLNLFGSSCITYFS